MSETPKRTSWLDLISDPIRRAILRSLSEVGEVSMAELKERAHVSETALRRHLNSLLALGLVREHRAERDGVTPGRPAARFSLDPEVRIGVMDLFEALSQPAGPDPLRIPGRAEVR